MNKKTIFENIKIAIIIGLTCLLGWGVITGLDSLTDKIEKEQQKRQIIKHDTILVCHIADTKELDKEMPLKCPADLHNFLAHHHIPFASEWTSLSIQESGWNWESYNAQVNHNMFGLSYCYFKNKYDCVNFLVNEWIFLDPPKKGEDFYQFITRRNFNKTKEDPNMVNYCNKIRGVEETRLQRALERM
jgi:hypothetical protein